MALTVGDVDAVSEYCEQVSFHDTASSGHACVWFWSPSLFSINRDIYSDSVSSCTVFHIARESPSESENRLNIHIKGRNRRHTSL